MATLLVTVFIALLARRASIPSLVEGNLNLEPFLLEAGTVRYGSAADFETKLSRPRLRKTFKQILGREGTA